MGRLRIVAGDLRGRRIEVPEGDSVRPTPDRVREALFSILGDRTAGARVADLFAGTGALGFEALSRGAAHVTFVEADPSVRRIIVANASALGVAGRCRVLGGLAESLLAGPAPGGPYELILADPPYDRPPDTGLLRALARGRWLATGGLAVIERESGRDTPEAAGIRRVRTCRYGRVSLDFFRIDPPESPDPADSAGESFR